MKAIITVDVPEYQIGQEVSVYFKDTMRVNGTCESETEVYAKHDAETLKQKTEAKCLDCLLTEKVVIKDNITNGDVIKAMFPNGQVFNSETQNITCRFLYGDGEYDEYVDFYTDWWNAPYNAESEDKYCDRNVCIQNEYNGIGCDECIYNPTESEDKNE